jgi:hypothetical protein
MYVLEKQMDTKERIQKVRRALSLLIEDGSIAELRVPKSDDGPLTGLFDDLGMMAKAAAELSGEVPGIYFGLNPPMESFVDRVENRLRRSAAVKDNDIERRHWLLVDFDPVRAANTPSTETEHEAALKLAKQCRRSLDSLGWPEPLFADSGNGAYLLFRIDLPNDDPSRELVKGCLELLALRFDNAKVRVDTGNFNASRIGRVPGTKNCKGTPSDERPHRFAKLLKVPEEIKVVSRSLLNQLASRLSGAVTVRRGFNVSEWVEKMEVPVVKDGPWKSDGHRWILQCPWNNEHTNNSAFIVQFPDGGVAAGCLHESCSDKKWPDFRNLYESDAEDGTAEPTGRSTNSGSAQKGSQTGELLDLASRDAQFFCTPQGDAYASVRVGNHFENHTLEGKAIKLWLRHRYFLKMRTAPKTQSVQEALSHFDAVARYEGAKEPVFVRVAEKNSINYLDLGDELWRAVELRADVWRIVENPPVKFRRAPGMLSLPTPITGGDINALKKFLNLRTQDDWILFITTLLEYLLFLTAYPVLGLHGEAGSGKTTHSRILRALIDPNASPARAMPKDARDLMILATNSWLLVFDNLSFLPTWFSDCLCRLSTGGGFATRQLYTDVGEVVFDGRRPVILNGVEELASRTDLLDRSIILDLPVIERYRSEREFWNQFEAAQPRLLGALLDVAVKALQKLPNVQLKDAPRLADFALLASAAESALGLSTGAFMTAYLQNRTDANAVALEASPIAATICELAQKGSWKGTAAGLLAKLASMSDDQTVNRRSWPKNARTLAGMLRRLASALRRTGIEVEFWRDGTNRRERMISISRTRKKPKQGKQQ